MKYVQKKLTVLAEGEQFTKTNSYYLLFYLDIIDDDLYDNETTNNENNGDEHFQIQSTEYDENYVLVNTRIDYQCRSDILNDMCLYDFVSTIYKKKMNASDVKYL